MFREGIRIRYVIMTLACLCLSISLSNILTFNFTVICMAGPPTTTDKGNGTRIPSETVTGLNHWLLSMEGILLHYIMEGDDVPVESRKYSYTPNEKSRIFSAVAVGALLAVYPLIWALGRWGPRKLFSLVGFVSAVSTALIPLAADYGVEYIYVCRAFQGAGLAVSLPVIGCVTSHWSTLQQNAFFIAILSSFLQIAPMFTMPVAGRLCISPLGWKSVYYLHGAMTVVLFGLFVLYYRDVPRRHSAVSHRELTKISAGKSDASGSRVPTRAILRSAEIWAIWVAAFGNFLGTQLTLQFTPIYLNKVLGIPVGSTGYVSAIPPFLMFFVKLAAGLTSDKVTFFSEKTKLRVYNTIALGGMSLFFLLLSIISTQHTVIHIVLLIAASCALGFNSGGFFKSSQLVARHHSHFVMGNISFINCLCMLIVPYMVEKLCPNNAPSEWSVVFLIHTAVLAICNVVYCYLPGYKAAWWTEGECGNGKVSASDMSASTSFDWTEGEDTVDEKSKGAMVIPIA